MDFKKVSGKKRFLCIKCGCYAAISKGNDRYKCEFCKSSFSLNAKKNVCYTKEQTLVLQTLLTLLDLRMNEEYNDEVFDIKTFTKLVKSRSIKDYKKHFKIKTKTDCEAANPQIIEENKRLEDFLVLSLTGIYDIEICKDILIPNKAIDLNDMNRIFTYVPEDKKVQQQLEEIQNYRKEQSMISQARFKRGVNT